MLETDTDTDTDVVVSTKDSQAALQSARAAAIRSLEALESRFGIELQSLFDETKYSYRDSIAEFQRRVVRGVNAHTGFAQEEGIDIQAVADPTEVEPNIFISRHNSLVVRNYTGNAVFDYVMVIRKNLDAMGSAASTAQFVAQTLGGTIIAVGVPVAIKVAAELIAKKALKDALMVAIKGVGLKSAIVAVVLAIAGIIYWLVWGVEQKILGAIINDTDTDYIVPDWRRSVDGYGGGNLYMEHGTTENFMLANLTGSIDSPEVQLKSRFVDENDENTMVAVGLFFADRKAGFRGAEGIYVFTPMPGHGSDPGFAYQFAIPYVNDNRANIEVYAGGKIDDKNVIAKMFRDLYNAAKVNVEKQVGDFSMKSHLNDSRGGRICGLTCVSTPVNYADAS
jgi:hypothetical protein